MAGALAWCWGCMGVGAVFSKVSGTDKEGSFIEFDMNWSVLLLHLASTAPTKKICGTAPIFISCFSGLHFRCNYRKLREQGPAESLTTVPTSALHNVTTQNSPKILTHLVVDGTQKVYDKYINKGRKSWRMSFSHSFLRPPVQCDVESVTALIRGDVILWIMYVAVWWQ